jgi:type IV secretory pathway VirB3-like protein
MPNVVGKLKGQLIIDATRAASVFTILYLSCHFSLGVKTAVICYSSVLAANYVACQLLYYHQAVSYSKRAFLKRDLEPTLLPSAPHL